VLDGVVDGVVEGVEGVAAGAEESSFLAAGVSVLGGGLVLLFEPRESVTYQPLPLKTMPTGWITLRRLPPHCSQVVNGGSEKLWRFSMS